MYFYLMKDSLESGTITVAFQTESAIPNYKEITNFGELIEYTGDNLPNQWEFDGEHFYDVSHKPSPYHRMNKEGQWEVFDKEGFKLYCMNKIDEVKAEVLEYGFDYNGHRQRCRDKDIAYMTSTITALSIAKQLKGKDIRINWYFEDNAKQEMGLVELGTLMMYGVTFVQSVFDTENYFKSLVELNLVTKEEFERKRQEIHHKLVEG